MSVDDTERQDDTAAPAEAARPLAAWLRVFGEPGGRAYPIAAAGTTIGRQSEAPTADVVLEDGRTSRQHARIGFEAASWRLRDLGSRNGAFVEGVPVAPGQAAELTDGTVIRLGDTVAVFAGAAAGTEDGERAFFPGLSAAAHQIRTRVRHLAAATGHVLVVGETGTGKERVARRIGDGAPVVPQNCAELSRETARSDLFGHVRGAFTGATTAREGLVDAASGGVLFLDEIGELPLDVQGELLRYLEDGSFRPMGASELRTSRARVVAATNVDLDEAVRGGTFRRDLLARLRASNRPLVLPALRHRREDIPGWADMFLRELAPDAPARPWSAGALECLLLYPWPENLRELRSVVRSALEGPRVWPIETARLLPAVEEHRRNRRALSGLAAELAKVAKVAMPPRAGEPPGRDEIVDALLRTEGRMRAAAEMLGIDRRRLYRLCEKYGVLVDAYRKGEGDD